ncbi:MAG: DUF2924 domain-containing protein, partial [Alphaproteobacteria bacterium]|nr:DUF2924 domain-containing protein [Alphaproteobacteria bacterium]
KLVSDLLNMNRSELHALWKSFFSTIPPVSQSALVFPIAYAFQKKKFGGLAQKHITFLNRYSKLLHSDNSVQKRTNTYSLREGTVLTRNYKGSIHSVSISKEGFIYNKVVYFSLSAVAHAITGKSWNGYVFFGLKEIKDKQNA